LVNHEWHEWKKKAKATGQPRLTRTEEEEKAKVVGQPRMTRMEEEKRLGKSNV
jgi:hypothetical protein